MWQICRTTGIVVRAMQQGERPVTTGGRGPGSTGAHPKVQNWCHRLPSVPRHCFPMAGTWKTYAKCSATSQKPCPCWGHHELPGIAKLDSEMQTQAQSWHWNSPSSPTEIMDLDAIRSPWKPWERNLPPGSIWLPANWNTASLRCVISGRYRLPWLIT